jgi:hypothetical protein
MKSNQQRGIALIIMMLVLAMVAMSAMFNYMDGSSVKIERGKKTAAALADAKAGLVGYMVKRKFPERAGDLPCPDKSTDKNYDGTQDSPCASSRLGMFPWSNVDLKGQYLDGIAIDLRDGFGERLWFVVSRNLVDPTNVKFIDEALLTNSNPTYPWLEVYDVAGNPITKKAVALIISPGFLLAGQSRLGSTPSAAQFLDTSTVNGIKFTNSSSVATKFISGLVVDPVSNMTISNDQIIFITTDELRVFISKLKVAS